MENGAASPGRWQLWQCCWRIGTTSFEYVGAFMFPICANTAALEHAATQNARMARNIFSPNGSMVGKRVPRSYQRVRIETSKLTLRMRRNVLRESFGFRDGGFVIRTLTLKATCLITGRVTGT